MISVKTFIIIVAMCMVIAYSAIVEELNSTTIAPFMEHYPYMIMAYAHWCNHCKRMLPVMEQVADYAGNRVAVGKINAGKYPKVTKAMNITRYPTVFFSTGRKVETYTGPRTFAALTEFIHKLDRATFPVVKSLDDIGLHMSEWHANSSFVLNLQCTEDNKSCLNIIEQCKIVAEDVKMHALVMLATDSVGSTLPKGLCKFDFHHDSDDSLLRARALYCIDPTGRDSISLAEYIQQNNYPLVSSFEDHNFRTLAHLNKTMMLGILDFSEKPTTDAAVRALQTTASKIMESHPHAFIFGYLDGKQKKRYAKHYEVIPPTILIVDHDDERHASVSVKGVDVSDYESFFQETMQKVISGEIELLQTNQPGLWRKISHRIERYQTFALLLFLAPIAFLLSSFFFPHPSKKTKQH